MANQILAGAVFQAGQVLAGIDADNILDTFLAPSTTSSTVANKILMWNSDYAHSVNNNGTYSGSTSQGGLFMADAAFANPLTLSPETPHSVAAGEGKVVSISIGGEINVYNSSTGALETTFTDTLLDNGKTSTIWGAANCCVIGAGKIFINSPEHNGAGVGSIIVVDLLDRNVPSFLITPALGDYSRIGQNSNGKLQFVDGKVVAGTSQWSAPDMGIHIFDPDGSNHTFIPTSFPPYRIEKFGDNYVASNGNFGVEILDISGQVLHSKNVGSYGFGFDIGVTSTNKLVVRRHSHQGGGVYEQFVHIYDEGFTNEIIISGSAQPSTSGGTTPAAAFWCHETLENCAGFTVFGEDILVAAPKASSDTVNESGAIYRYNDSGVLQEIFYGTVAGQRLGVNIVAGTETTTTTLPSFIAPSTGSGAKYYVVTAYKGDDGASGAGGAYVFDANDPTAAPTKLLSPDPYQNQFLGTASAASSNHIVLGTWRDDGGNSGDYSKGAAYVYDVNDLTATPTKLTAFDGQGGDRFGWSVAASSDKIYVGATDANNQGTSTTDGAVYVYDANDLSATPTRIDPFDAQTYPGKNFGVSVDVNSDHLFVGAFWGTTPTDSKMGAVYVYDVNDLSATPTKLTAFDDNPDDNARFGQYLSASSDYLVVGSHSDYINLTGDPQKSGTAYVYDLSDLSAQPTKIGPFDANHNDSFGADGSIAVSSSYVIVGSKGDDVGGSDTGSVYVYDLSDLSATPTKITEPSPEQFAEFSKVAVFSDKLIVGAGQGGGVMSGTDTGTAYVYDLNDLSAAPTPLLAGDGESGDMFGQSVSIVPTPVTTLPAFIAPPIIASAPTYLRSIDGNPNQQLGQGISIHEDYIFVSNGRSTNQGELYIYDATDLSVSPVIFNPPQHGGADWGSNHHYDSTRKLLIVGNGYANLHSGSNSGGVISFYDLTDINNIVTVREFGGPGVNQYIGQTVAVGGGKAYTSKTTGAFGEPNVLYSFDLDDLQSGPVVYDRPSHVVDDRDYWGRHMDADDEYLYVWDQMGDRIVYIYDVNNPLTLITTANYPVDAGDINYRPTIAGDYWIMTRYGNPAVSIFEKGTGNLVKVIGKGVDWLNSGQYGVPAGAAIDTYPTYNGGARMYGKYLGLWSPNNGADYGTAEYEIDILTFYDTTDWSADPIVLSFEGRGGGYANGEDGSSSIALNPVNNELWWGSGNHNGESSVEIFDASSIVGA